MNRQELKDALVDLHLQEPEFFKDLIGEVIKENLIIDYDCHGRHYDTNPTIMLRWREDDYYSCDPFTRTY